MQFGIPMSLPISAPHLQQAAQSQPADPSQPGFVVALEQGSTPAALQQPAHAQPTVMVRHRAGQGLKIHKICPGLGFNAARAKL